MFHFDEKGRPKIMTQEEWQEKTMEGLIPNYKEVMEMNKRGGSSKPSNPHDFQHKEGMNNKNSGFSVLGEKDKIPKKKDCNSECPRTTGDKKMSQKGIDFLKGYESEVKKNGKHVLYDDDSGYCTIGYGHLVDGKKSCANIKNMSKSFKNGLTDKEAEDLFREDLKEREKAVNKLVKKPICQQEFDAMLSLVYNVGAGNLKISNVLKYTNMGKSEEAKKWFKSFEKSNGKRLNGLVKRRKAESNMYECGTYDSSH